LAVALVCTCAVAFHAASRGSFTGFIPVLLYLPLPLVLWATVRFGVKGASGAILIVTVTSIGMTLDGYNIFGRSDADLNVLALQLFLTAFSVPVLLLGSSVEDMHQAERITGDLAQKLIWSHDEERRRTAKELHEGICQDLVATSLDASRIAGLHQADLAWGLQRLERNLQKSIADLRSTSYLLYPPLLDESGLETALRSFVERFSRGSSMSVGLSVSADLGRLQSDIEIAVFRFVQDALSNISQRSRHPTANIRVTCCGPNVIVSVAQGCALRASALSSLLRKAVPIAYAKESVDLAGMRARLQRIGGTLELETNGGATLLKAIIGTRATTTA
jgi:signal transduction histidine kinase